MHANAVKTYPQLYLTKLSLYNYVQKLNLFANESGG